MPAAALPPLPPRSRVVTGGRHTGCLRPARYHRGATSGTAALWPRHGVIAAGGSRCRQILGHALGSGRLILSTPLTLCLVVAGRHVKALGILELLSSDAQPLTLPQRFYQRALSGDPHEIIANARAFLKRDSLAAYSDRVLIPALHLVRLDADMGATSEDQRRKIGRVILDVVAALSSNGLKFPRRRRRGSVLEDVSAGRLATSAARTVERKMARSARGASGVRRDLLGPWLLRR